MHEGMVWYALIPHFHRDIALKPTLFGLVVRGCLDNAGQLNRGHQDIVVKPIENAGFHQDIVLKTTQNQSFHRDIASKQIDNACFQQDIALKLHQFHRDIASEPIEKEGFHRILLQNK